MIGPQRGSEPLYKYYSSSTTATVLRTGRIRWSAPAVFNDPFDHSFEISMSGDQQAEMERFLEQAASIVYSREQPVIRFPSAFTTLLLFQRASVDRLQDRQAWINEMRTSFAEGSMNAASYLAEQNQSWERASKSARIFCLSEFKDVMPMWAHYGDNHTGVVLEFRGAESLDSPFLAARPVQYHSEMPKLGDYRALFDGILGNCPPAASEDLYHSLAFVKADQWSYENEWRIITYREEGDFDDFKFNPLELQAVYLGTKCRDADVVEINLLIAKSYPFTKIYRMATHPGEFSLIPDLVRESDC